jgi:predicted Zn finger-like uncharacterized protein
MKFLCPSCKTKYQIADDKVSGRAVRMKCRKCGFVIPISEVPPAPPTMAPPPGGERLPPVPKAPPPPRGFDAAPASRPASKPAALPVQKPVPTPAPKPVGAPVSKLAATPAPKVVRPGAPSVLGTSKGIGPPPATPLGSAAVEAQRKSPAPSDLIPAFDDADEQPTAIVSGGALAAAFGALVTAPSAKPVDSVMPADEWYVGINDVSVGPIRLAELRAKAASGAVQAESLVWRDGLEDWRPLKAFPELLAVLEESLSSVRASAFPLAAPARRDNDFGTPLPSGVTSVGLVTDDLAAAGLTRPRTPLAAWFAMAAALACGIAIGAFFFVKQKPPEVITKYVDRPVPGAEQPAAVGAEVPVADTPAGAGSAAAKTRTGPRTNVKPVAATEADKGGGLSGLKGLDGLRPTGPGPGSTPGTTSPGGGGSQLDQSQIQSTVSRYTGSVKRSCWQPALDSRDPSAPTSARVVVTITVAPSGNVQNVTTSGEPRGYPGLATCIAGRVRAWQFPPSSGTTTANVPFVFAAQ